jgi:hypothetical protein
MRCECKSQDRSQEIRQAKTRQKEEERNTITRHRKSQETADHKAIAKTRQETITITTQPQDKTSRLQDKTRQDKHKTKKYKTSPDKANTRQQKTAQDNINSQGNEEGQCEKRHRTVDWLPCLSFLRDNTIQYKTRQYKTRQDDKTNKTRQDKMTKQNKTRQEKARQGKTSQDRQDMARYDL